MTRIFTVVPDDRVSQQIATSLQLEGFLVDSAITARDALYRVTGGGYELVIVEYSIADIDAAGNVERCVRMLKSGADDYQPSPLDFEELGARVLGLLRRRTRAQPSGIAGAVTQLQAASITLDRIRRTVIVDSKLVILRPTEFRLAASFLSLAQAVNMASKINEHQQKLTAAAPWAVRAFASIGSGTGVRGRASALTLSHRPKIQLDCEFVVCRRQQACRPYQPTVPSRRRRTLKLPGSAATLPMNRTARPAHLDVFRMAFRLGRESRMAGHVNA